MHSKEELEKYKEEFRKEVENHSSETLKNMLENYEQYPQERKREKELWEIRKEVVRETLKSKY